MTSREIDPAEDLSEIGAKDEIHGTADTRVQVVDQSEYVQEHLVGPVDENSGTDRSIYTK